MCFFMHSGLNRVSAFFSMIKSVTWRWRGHWEWPPFLSTMKSAPTTWLISAFRTLCKQAVCCGGWRQSEWSPQRQGDVEPGAIAVLSGAYYWAAA